MPKKPEPLSDSWKLGKEDKQRTLEDFINSPPYYLRDGENTSTKYILLPQEATRYVSRIQKEMAGRYMLDSDVLRHCAFIGMGILGMAIDSPAFVGERRVFESFVRAAEMSATEMEVKAFAENLSKLWNKKRYSQAINILTDCLEGVDDMPDGDRKENMKYCLCEYKIVMEVLTKCDANLKQILFTEEAPSESERK